MMQYPVALISTPIEEKGSEAPSRHYTEQHTRITLESTMETDLRAEKEIIESTPAGDVVFVDPSYDRDDPAAPVTKPSSDENMNGTNTSSPRKKSHRRELSAHFHEAARLSESVDRHDAKRDEPQYATQQAQYATQQAQYPTQQAQYPSQQAQYPSQQARPRKHHDINRTSPARDKAAFAKAANQTPMSPAVHVGNKHRRGYSGGISNPAVAHRRINSIGDSAPVDRYYYGYHPTSRPQLHRREDSAGLDILSAVADESKEQLAIAAGHRRHPSKTWEPPSAAAAAAAEAATTLRHAKERRMDPPQPVHPSYDQGPPQYHSMGPPSSYPHYPPPGPYSYQHSPLYHHSFLHSHAPFYPPGGPSPPAGYHPSQSPTYPVQFAPPKDPYQKRGIEQPILTESGPRSEGVGFPKRRETSNDDYFPPGNTTGVQTLLTAMDAGKKSRSVMPAPTHRNTATNTDAPTPPLPDSLPVPSTIGHHRKLSSYSSLGTLMNSGIFTEPEHPAASAPVAARRHHRKTSSSVSFLGGLDDTDGDIFLQNLAPPPPVSSAPKKPVFSNGQHVVSSDHSTGRSLASGGTSKRVRRKCTVDDCPNRVVQGGLCIAHGAKRKTCKHPGCEKNVKKAGLCSTHGPARKRCEEGDCNKVAVQGGRCIAHGAKKKLCSFTNCTKQAILSGMCKKHHDSTNGSVGQDICTIIEDKGTKPNNSRPGHARGLSIFQEMSAESVQDFLSSNDSGPHPLKG